MNRMPCSGARSQGFTLIEIIAVIVIIGLMASIIAVSMTNRGGGASPTRTEAQTFLQAVDFVSEQSVLNGEIIGMFVELKDTEDSSSKQWCYRWQRFRDGSWGNLPEDTLSEHCLPVGMEWDMSIEGHLFSYDADLETQPPALVWSPSGESTPIEMKLFETGMSVADGKSEVQHIEIDMMGNSHWLEQEEEDERSKSKKR